MILKARAACSLPSPNPEEYKLAIVSWLEVLEPVHVAWLDTCYAKAIRAHKGERPFGAFDVVAIWNHASTNGDFEAWLKAENRSLPRPNCDDCSNTGWRRLTVDGISIAFDDQQPGSRVARCECGR